MPVCGRHAVEVPLDQDLLLTFSDGCKPAYAPYSGPVEGEDPEKARPAEEPASSREGRWHIGISPQHINTVYILGFSRNI